MNSGAPTPASDAPTPSPFSLRSECVAYCESFVDGDGLFGDNPYICSEFETVLVDCYSQVVDGDTCDFDAALWATAQDACLIHECKSTAECGLPADAPVVEALRTEITIEGVSAADFISSAAVRGAFVDGVVGHVNSLAEGSFSITAAHVNIIYLDSESVTFNDAHSNADDQLTRRRSDEVTTVTVGFTIVLPSGVNFDELEALVSIRNLLAIVESIEAEAANHQEALALQHIDLYLKGTIGNACPCETEITAASYIPEEPHGGGGSDSDVISKSSISFIGTIAAVFTSVFAAVLSGAFALHCYRNRSGRPAASAMSAPCASVPCASVLPSECQRDPDGRYSNVDSEMSYPRNSQEMVYPRSNRSVILGEWNPHCGGEVSIELTSSGTPSAVFEGDEGVLDFRVPKIASGAGSGVVAAKQREFDLSGGGLSTDVWSVRGQQSNFVSPTRRGSTKPLLRRESTDDDSTAGALRRGSTLPLLDFRATEARAGSSEFGGVLDFRSTAQSRHHLQQRPLPPHFAQEPPLPAPHFAQEPPPQSIRNARNNPYSSAMPGDEERL